LFLDPKLLNKSAVRFVLWWNLLNKFFISPESEFVWVPLRLKVLGFWVLHQFCSMMKFVEQNWTKRDFVLFPIYNLKMKLRLEVLFKKFHPRINLITFFLTKSYLLNTIKPFSGHENRFLTKFQKPFTRRVPLGTWTSKLWVCRTSSWPKKLREPKLHLSRSYGLGCRRGTNFCQRRRRRRVTDEFFFSRIMTF
jgi:hypothetical protein